MWIMRNKKIVLATCFLVLLAVATAFIAGKLFNRRVSPIASDRPLREGSGFTLSSPNNITPAPELPTVPPDVTGLYLELKDNTMTVQAVTFDLGLGGIVGDSSADLNSPPKAEILMTSKTTIYRDTTQFSQSVSGEGRTIEQTVQESTLDEITPPTMITVWGRKSGDRIIATVLLFSNSLNIQKP